MSYYNTTRQKGEQLKVSWKKTESQDNKVMDYFNTHGRATPSEVWLHFNKHENNVPITSISTLSLARPIASSPVQFA